MTRRKEEVLNRNTQELINAGSDILKSVTAAVDKNDYSRLAADISGVVKSVNVHKTAPSRGTLNQGITITYNNPQKQNEEPNYFLQKKVNKSLGLPQMVVSATFGAFTAIMALGQVIASSVAGMAIYGIFSAACWFSFYKGRMKNNLVDKYYKYGGVLGGKEYFNISELAGAVFRTDKEVLKDIKNMIKGGLLPRARLDESEKTCMITDNAYELYQGALIDREARIQREKALDNQKSEAYANTPDEVKAIIDEGNEYIAFIRYINDIIPDTEEMSNKLYRLEDIMNRIFKQVEKEPESADDLYKLMNYYLPTTKKLLNAYVELDKQPNVGDNITKTKLEIDSAMDTINEAFENLLNSLFRDMAWDISSDISVMKTMMTQDGLVEGGINNNR